eukprot:6186319-Pleurochrysis_carterae.AAC.4
MPAVSCASSTGLPFLAQPLAYLREAFFGKAAVDGTSLRLSLQRVRLAAARLKLHARSTVRGSSFGTV